MFPTEFEKERSRKIEDYYSLYLGNYGRVLHYFRSAKEKRQQLEVIQNVAGMVSRVFADLMFSEPVKVTVPDDVLQKRVDDFLSRNKAQNKFLESALTQSYGGVTYFEMYLQDGLAYFHELNPAVVFPQYNNMFGGGEPESVIISWECQIGEHSYRFVKTHYVGKITYELRKIEKTTGKDLGWVSLATLDPNLPDWNLGDYEETDWDYIPVYQINNLKTSREQYGISDYADVLTLLEELTRAESQIATQLKKHAGAKMAVPPGVLNNNGTIRSEDAEMFEVNADEHDIVPQYIVNGNPQIDQAFKQKESILEAIARVTEVSTLLMDWNVSGGAEKVGALRLRILRTLAKVKRKLRSYDSTIREMTVDAIQMEGIGTTLENKDVVIEFADGLPKDMLEQTQIETMRYNGGLQTVKDAIRNLDNLEGDALDAKLLDMDAEKKKQSDAVASSIPSFGFGA